MMRTIALIMFFIVTGIHLYASLKQDKLLRNRTKPFILLLLSVYYGLSAEPVISTVVLALFFSWLGDVLLIPSGIKWFTAGGISFMVSHVFFIITYAGQTDFSGISRVLMIFLPALFITASAIAFKYLKPSLPKALFYPMLLYLMINGAMNCFAWFRSFGAEGTAAVLTAVGALLFYMSDTSLFFVRFSKNSRLKTHFFVMLTYALGEFLIIRGLILQ